MTRRDARQLLDDFVARYHRADFRDADPVGLVHQFRRPEDVEVAAFIAAALAYGRAAQIRASVSRVYSALGDRPFDALLDPAETWTRPLTGFAHRFTAEVDLVSFLRRTSGLIRTFGSLERAFAAGDDGGPSLRPAMIAFADAFRVAHPSPCPPYLLPTPADGSACKRFCLFLRWMARPADGIDFGLWPGVGPHRLVMPLDTHVARISRRLGLLRRKSNDWKAAEEVTRVLRGFAPDDPLRYDFAITHIGITGLWRDLIP